jgi:hypothetical protein
VSAYRLPASWLKERLQAAPQSADTFSVTLCAMHLVFAWFSAGNLERARYRKIVRYATGSRNRKIATPAAQAIRRRTSLRDTLRPD